MRSLHVGLALAALCACGNSLPPAPTCTPQSCAGCCAEDGRCELPTPDHCGISGAACVACAAELACIEGACRPGETGSSGTSASGGSTGSSSSATGGSSGSSAASGSGSTGGSSGGSGSTGGDCCLSLNCAVACDPYACACLSGGGSTTGGPVDAGSLCQTQSCVIYAETPHTLFQVDPNPPNALTRLCDFTGDIPGDAGVNDIAVQRDGTLYGITRTELYRIAPQTCAGTHVATLAAGAGSYNCLTFTDSDTLVAADANGQVVTISTATGQYADAGRFGGGYGCSGDIVALSNGQMYATAKYLRDGGVKDMLVTLDPSSGYSASRVSNATLGYKSIFGLGYWGGTLYGFDSSGDELAIDPVAGTSVFLRNVPGTTFYGAGTTPLAPVVSH